MQGFSTSRPETEGLLAFYDRVRTQTETLCEPLEIEDYIPQPTVDVSPPKWNIAHTTWFFEEMILTKFAPDYKVFDKNYGFLFNSYYNSIGERTKRDDRGSLSRPTVREVYAYRKHVDAAMRGFLAAEPAADVRELIILGLNHEQQHQELLLSDLKYSLSVNPLFPVYREGFFPEEQPETGEPGHAEFSAGVYEIGYSGDGFSFDNEHGRHKVYLNDFGASRRLVTNGEYIEFIEADGYSDFSLWHSEGWDWVVENEIQSPLYWRNDGGEWSCFTLGGLRPLDLESPVCHVSFFEAAAFAQWKRTRLLTESEWEVASESFDWGQRWEWTESAYLPYPGFSKAPGAVGEYNGKFMINQMVLRGGSAITPEGHSRKTYRNFFAPHLRWQFTGIRLAK